MYKINETAACLRSAFHTFKSLFPKKAHCRTLRCNNECEFTGESLDEFSITYKLATSYVHEHTEDVE